MEVRPVKPVPSPMITRPGTSWLIVAIECAGTGALRLPGIATALRALPPREISSIITLSESPLQRQQRPRRAATVRLPFLSA